MFLQIFQAFHGFYLGDARGTGDFLKIGFLPSRGGLVASASIALIVDNDKAVVLRRMVGDGGE